jgi:hypothetical protein
MASPPTRIDADIYEAARAHGALVSRSAAQQIAHWARIGRELEMSPSVSSAEIARVLAGAADYDDLSEREQAVVRASWAEQIRARAAALDLGPVFAAQGRTEATESDASGRKITTRQLDSQGRPKPATKPRRAAKSKT